MIEVTYLSAVKTKSRSMMAFESRIAVDDSSAGSGGSGISLALLPSSVQKGCGGVAGQESSTEDIISMCRRSIRRRGSHRDNEEMQCEIGWRKGLECSGSDELQRRQASG